MTVTLLIGGARSGKSSLAVARALDWQRGGSPIRNVVFVATGSAGDGEMADRILRHQAERPESWGTVEAPVDLVAGLRSACGFSFSAPSGSIEGSAADSTAEFPALIVDCLSMWVANHLMGPAQKVSEEELSASEDIGPYDNPVDVDWDAAERELLRQVEEGFALLRTRSAPTWFVTNEVGLSLVPMSVMGRHYRDILGRVNAKVSLLADEAFLTVAGRVLRLDRP
jgi:adenosylcobinamide kinase / adenosylcobinamide-phosphate guanylyltransferase